jgi:hypothetical protein
MGDGLNGDGSVERAGAHRATPIQTGRAPRVTQRPTEPQTETRAPGPPAGADARLNRFVSGTAAPGGGGAAQKRNPPSYEFDPGPAQGDAPPAEAYASELPDLSGPIPRSPQRKPAPDRTAEVSSPSGGAATAESRESKELRENRVKVSRRTRGPVRASMQIRRIDPWSTLKVSLMLSVALFFVWMLAVAFLYLVLGGMGVWAKLNSNVGDLLNNTSGSSGELVSSSTIFGGAVLIGLVNIVLLTAMATVAAFVYNLTSDLIGGVEVTLADRD